jgi:hypothetical protein
LEATRNSFDGNALFCLCVAVTEKVPVFDRDACKRGFIDGLADFLNEVIGALRLPVFGNDRRKAEHAAFWIGEVGDFESGDVKFFSEIHAELLELPTLSGDILVAVKIKDDAADTDEHARSVELGTLSGQVNFRKAVSRLFLGYIFGFRYVEE